MLSYMLNLPIRTLASAAFLDHEHMSDVEITHLLGLILGTTR